MPNEQRHYSNELNLESVGINLPYNMQAEQSVLGAALMDAATTDACLDILDGAQLRAPVLESILAAIQMHLDRRAGGAFRVGAVLFSNQHGPLGETKTAKELMQEWQN